MAGGSNGHQRAAILDAGTMTRNDPATEMKEAATEATLCQAEGPPLHLADACVRHDLRDRAGGARGQRLQLTIIAGAEPLRNRSRHDTLAVARHRGDATAS